MRTDARTFTRAVRSCCRGQAATFTDLRIPLHAATTTAARSVSVRDIERIFSPIAGVKNKIGTFANDFSENQKTDRSFGTGRPAARRPRLPFHENAMILAMTSLSFFRYMTPAAMLNAERFAMTPVRSRNPRRIALAAGLALATSTVAPSPASASYERAKSLCMGDAMRLCSSEIPSIARITACMRRNKANVSSGCRAVMDEMDGTAAARAKPVQAAAPPAPKPVMAPRPQPPAVTRPPAQAVEQKPVAPPRIAVAPVVAPAAAEPKPVQAASLEPKPVAEASPASLVWSEAKTMQPAAADASLPVALAQVAPDEPKPVAGTSLDVLGWFERRAAQIATGEASPAAAAPAPIEAAPLQTQQPEPGPAAAVVAQPPAIGTKPPPSAPAAEPPVIAFPVVAPVVTTAKPVQPAAAVAAPAAVAPANAKPVTVKPAPVVRSVRVAQRKTTRHRHVRVARHDYYGGVDVDRAMAIALPIMASMLSYW